MAFAVIGMDEFGLFLTHKLAENGQEVLAVDKREERLKNAASFATHMISGDASDEKFVSKLGVKNFDAVIVSINDIQSAVLTVLNLKQLGCPYTAAKVTKAEHGKVLEKIGADLIITPDKDAASRLAQRLTGGGDAGVGDYVKFAEMPLPGIYLDKLLSETDIKKYGHISVIVIKRGDTVIVSPGGNEKLLAGDSIIVCGEPSSVSVFIRSVKSAK